MKFVNKGGKAQIDAMHMAVQTCFKGESPPTLDPYRYNPVLSSLLDRFEHVFYVEQEQDDGIGSFVDKICLVTV